MVGTDKNVPKRRPRVLIVFNTVCLYGMERTVIETFDLLRSEVTPIFLIPRSNRRYQTVLFRELEAKKFEFRFFSDYWGWLRVGKPHGFFSFMSLVFSIVLANLNVLRNSVAADFLYLPGWTSAVYSLLGVSASRLAGKKVIFSFHDLMLKSPRKVSLSVAVSTDLVHNTSYSYEAVRRRNPCLDAKRNHVIPPAIELRTGTVTASSSAKRKFVFIGQVSLHKGIDLLVQAFKYVSKQHPDTELHIVGGFDSQFQKQLRDLFGDCEPIKCWGYLDAAHGVLASSYAYVHPSPPSRFHESFGRGAVEAMAFGVPVICFASGALREIIHDGVNGLLCQEETAECLAEQMARLLTDASFRDRLSEGALRVYSRTYSNDIVKQAWLRLLNATDHRSCMTLDRHIAPLKPTS